MRGAVLVIMIIFFVSTDLKGGQSTFSIYLPAEKEYKNQLVKEDLQKIKLHDKPILSANDIIVYSKNTHEIELTPSAYKRIMQLDPGTPFIVCVGKERIYAGAIWSDLYSTSFDGVVISKPVKTDKYVIRLQLGYPSPHFFKGKDPRSDPKVLHVLQQTGKLKDKNKIEDNSNK